MNVNEEFDELARRKLTERDFPFQEADWRQARQQIDAQRGGRNWAPWAIGGVLLLVVAGLIWRYDAQEITGPTTATLRQAQVANGAGAVVHNGASTGGNNNAVSGAQGQPVAAPSITASTEGTALHASPAHAESGSITAGVTAASASTQPARHGSVRTKSGTPRHAATASYNDDAGGSGPAMKIMANGHASADSNAMAHSTASTAQRTAVPDTGTSPTFAKTDDELLAQANVLADELPLAAQGDAARHPAPADAAGITRLRTILTLPSDTASPQPVAAVPLLVPRHAPWELSVQGGLFSSKTAYTGGNSEQWSGGTGQAQSMGAGAELMHMGRNFGLGLGLHYGTYAERVRMDARDIITTSVQPYWYLAAVDTTILLITGTIPGQPPTYTGQSITTTVLVLTQGMDTVTQSHHVRDARDVVNRVSYVEMPLLADGHLVQGRWSLGLRGGPTIALLTGRRGSLPNATDDGYLGFNEVAFREVTFGYTARAYIRYRFNAAWSVGIEPTLRGQLMNSLGSGELQRRSSAKGVLLSLTYRLR